MTSLTNKKTLLALPIEELKILYKGIEACESRHFPVRHGGNKTYWEMLVAINDEDVQERLYKHTMRNLKKCPPAYT